MMAAARAASILMYAGVQDIRLLNGGYQEWVSAGYEIDKQLNSRFNTRFWGKSPVHPKYIIDLKNIRESLNNENVVLADT